MTITKEQQEKLDAVRAATSLVAARKKAVSAVLEEILAGCEHNQDLTASLSLLADVLGSRQAAAVLAGQALADIAFPGGLTDG